MARRKLFKRHVRKLARIGNRSVGLTLPIGIVRRLRWRKGQKVVVRRVGKRVVVEDWPVRRAQGKPARRRSGKK